MRERARMKIQTYRQMVEEKKAYERAATYSIFYSWITLSSLSSKLCIATICSPNLVPESMALNISKFCPRSGVFSRPGKISGRREVPLLI